MIINRIFCMPNKWTFVMKPLKNLIDFYANDGNNWIDPFAGKYSPAEITNDLNPERNTKYHLSAEIFLKKLQGNKYKGCLFDPPYSLRQIKECYEKLGKPLNQWTTQKFYSDIKDLISNLILKDGFVISCGWNSIGMGKKRGFEMIEVLLLTHGRSHNDTIVTVEKKL